ARRVGWAGRRGGRPRRGRRAARRSCRRAGLSTPAAYVGLSTRRCVTLSLPRSRRARRSPAGASRPGVAQRGAVMLVLRTHRDRDREVLAGAVVVAGPGAGKTEAEVGVVVGRAVGDVGGELLAGARVRTAV